MEGDDILENKAVHTKEMKMTSQMRMTSQILRSTSEKEIQLSYFKLTSGSGNKLF